MRTKGGEAISSDFIETRLKFSPYIKEAVVWGEARDYITGFINIDFGNVGSWAEDRMIPYTPPTQIFLNSLLLKSSFLVKFDW